jgi:large subunit ribosomal protein L13
MERALRVSNLYSKLLHAMDYVLDAKNKRLGRLASEVAVILQGKKHADYNPRNEGSDRVLIKNISSISIGGNKEIDKTYYRHTGYMGHLKEKSYKQMFEKDPKKVLWESVRRMLPKNFLNQRRMQRLIFVETNGKEN